MTRTIDPERLAALDALTIDHGGHRTWEDGHCAMEVVVGRGPDWNDDPDRTQYEVAALLDRLAGEAS